MKSSAASHRPASLAGVSLTMFLIFAGFSVAQFHGWLFEKRGLGGLRVGLLLTAGYSAGILSPLMQVSIIRFFHGPRRPLLAALFGAGVCLALLPFARGFAALLPLFMLFSLCNSAIFPLNAACTFEVVRGRGHGLYFLVRGLGTVGFLVGCFASLFFPNPAQLPVLYAGFAAALLCALAVVAWDYRHVPPGEAPEDILVNPHPRAAPTFERALRLLGEPTTLRLIISLGVMNFANTLVTCVQGNYLAHRFGEGQRSISLAWVVSTACEVPLMLLCARLVKTRSLSLVIGLGIGGTLLKILGVAAAGSLWQFYLALAMHGWFYSGALTGFGVHLDRTFRKEDSPALQSLAIVFYQGLPMALAGLSAGWIWHRFSLGAVYLVAAAIASVISVYALAPLRGMEKPPPVAAE